MGKLEASGTVNDHQHLGGMQETGLGLRVGSPECLIRTGRDRNLFIRRVTWELHCRVILAMGRSAGDID